MKNIFKIFSIILAIFISININGQVSPTADKINPILVGQKVPNTLIQKINGESIYTDDIFKDKNTVLIFYRGGWCPYCTLHLREIGDIEDKLIELGYQIVAITPDAPDKIRATEEKEKLSYTLLSDSNTDFMQKMGIAFVGNEKYKQLFIDSSNGANANGVLPVPSVFFLDKTGKIVFSFVDPNYKKRLSSKLVLAIAENLE
jgi:peroxiredoxin